MAAGEVGWIGIATNDVFVVVELDPPRSEPSDGGERGIVWAQDVLSPESAVLASAMIPVLTELSDRW